MYVLDTDVVSHLMRGRLPELAMSRLAGLSRDAVRTTSITLGELYFGALRSAHAKRWLEAVEAMRGRLTCLSFDPLAAEHYGDLRAHLEAKGRRIDDADLRIAAICRSTGSTLVSGNARHFERVPGLCYENWLAPRAARD